MGSLEHEVIEKFRLLDREAQQRVWAMLGQELAASAQQVADVATFDYDAWFRRVKELRQVMQMHHGGELPAVDVVGILRDIRDGEDE